MKQKKFANELRILIILISFILLVNFISAFGIGCAYHKARPLEIYVGQTENVKVSLQNMAGSETVTLRARVLKGSEVIQLADSTNEYTVPVGGEQIANFKVTIPDSIEIGTTYPIELEFATITKSESGTFALGSSVGKTFDVIIIASPEEKKAMEINKKIITYSVLGVLALLIIVIVIIYFVKKKRQVSKFSKPVIKKSRVR